MQALTTSATAKAGFVGDTLESGYEVTPPPVAPAGDTGPVEQIARVRLTLQVQVPAGRSPRETSSGARAERVRGELEHWILEVGDAETVEPGVVLLAIPYGQEILLDMEVEISIEAQDRNCTCAIDAQWGKRRWPHSGLPDERSTARAEESPPGGET